jgi:hypothetical protein
VSLNIFGQGYVLVGHFLLAKRRSSTSFQKLTIYITTPGFALPTLARPRPLDPSSVAVSRSTLQHRSIPYFASSSCRKQPLLSTSTDYRAPKHTTVILQQLRKHRSPCDIHLHESNFESLWRVERERFCELTSIFTVPSIVFVPEKNSCNFSRKLTCFSLYCFTFSVFFGLSSLLSLLNSLLAINMPVPLATKRTTSSTAI